MRLISNSRLSVSLFRAWILASVLLLCIERPCWGQRVFFRGQKEEIQRMYQAQRDSIAAARQSVESASLEMKQEPGKLIREAQAKMTPETRKDLEKTMYQLETRIVSANHQRIGQLTEQINALSDKVQTSETVTLQLLADKAKYLIGFLTTLVGLVIAIFTAVEFYWKIRKLKAEIAVIQAKVG